MDLGLSGRACIVTGATRGIGLATARALRHEGASVLMVGRDAAALETAAEECGGAPLVGDITEPSVPAQAVDVCLERFGRLDVLVNNAGQMDLRALEELTEEEWRLQWELSVMAPMRLMRLAAPIMARSGYGRIVNVSSSAGKRPTPGNAAYSVAKAGQLALSRVFSESFAKQGVLINAIAPGPVKTPLYTGPGGLAEQAAAAAGGDATPEQMAAEHAQRLPIGRLGTAEEVAGVIVFLCSSVASIVAGSAWSVDGGAVHTIL